MTYQVTGLVHLQVLLTALWLFGLHPGLFPTPPLVIVDDYVRWVLFTMLCCFDNTILSFGESEHVTLDDDALNHPQRFAKARLIARAPVGALVPVREQLQLWVRCIANRIAQLHLMAEKSHFALYSTVRMSPSK